MVRITLITLIAAASLAGAKASLEVKSTGALAGRVTFTGAAPAPESVDMSSEPYCATAHQNSKAERRSVRLGAQNGLADVVVHVKGVAANSSRPVPTEPVMLDQRGCFYQPAVLALRVGQPLLVRNSDGVLHNVHVKPTRNAPFNLGQPGAGTQARRSFRMPELAIAVQCDIHDWMHASIAVFDHSFFNVTSDDGQFSIDGLPPGEYEVEAWHPRLGRQSQRISIPSGGSAQVMITFAAK